MKRILFIIVLFLFAGFAAVSIVKNKVNKDLNQPVYSPTTIPTPSLSPIKIKGKASLSLFVPYWTLNNSVIDANEFDKLIYFGVKPDKQGISPDDEELKKFNESRPADSTVWLAVRMTDNQENLSILGDGQLEQKIVDQSIAAAVNNNMSGVVLDLEISAIPFESLTKQINKFSSLFYTESKKSELSYSLTLYGDSLYRSRPYEIKTLAQNADSVMIMAYDLSKANGNPGPNFPLTGHEKYGYDLGQMSDDFLQFVPAGKINVVFGLFGYDWIVDDKGNMTKAATSLTFSQIKQKFLDNCDFNDCKISRDTQAGETNISYVDRDNNKHLVWFEDMESVAQKEDYLKQRGINSFSYWAYSYY